MIQKASGITWTKANGNDDQTIDSVIVSGDRITYHVKTSDHNNEAGSYYSTIQIETSSGTLSRQTTIEVPKPVVSQGMSNLKFTNVTSEYS